MSKHKGPKVLLIDIETAPILGYVWGLWENNVGLNQVKSDWHILSFAAKWLDEPASKMVYRDQRNEKNIENDRKLLAAVWDLLNEADIVITQNGVSFDIKKINARFILQGFAPPSPFKNIDTKLIASKKFGFTSNKLEYMADKLCTKYKKLKHKKFEGFTLWTECLKGNLDAWREMEKYNKYDVLVLEELYKVLRPWDSRINFNTYTDSTDVVCQCGSTHFEKRGFLFTASGKYQRYCCLECGAWTRDGVNLHSKEKIKSLRKSAG